MEGWIHKEHRKSSQKTKLKEIVDIAGSETTLLYPTIFREVGSRWGEDIDTAIEFRKDFLRKYRFQDIIVDENVHN